jgi:hypothetical protein
MFTGYPNLAWTLRPASMVTTQSPVPVQAPVHPMKTAPGSGTAERVTEDPGVHTFEQTPPQRIPSPVTLPPRVRRTDRRGQVGVGVEADVCVQVGVNEGVQESVCVEVGVQDRVPVSVGVLVAVEVRVTVPVQVTVGVSVEVTVCSGVLVEVPVEDGVTVKVAVSAVGRVSVAVRVGVGVAVAVGVALRVPVTVAGMSKVSVGVEVGVAATGGGGEEGGAVGLEAFLQADKPRARIRTRPGKAARERFMDGPRGRCRRRIGDKPY